jgi:cytochrome b pre-mRNA-processing protein 3
LTDTDAERNPMIMSLFHKKTDTEPVYAVYNSIVAQSRQPVFYAQWGVPDTVTGRFDMISLHMALLFRRLRHGPEGSKEFSQALFDLFFKDMDRSLREMGVSDLGVPKKIQKMGNIFFGLLAAMNEAMDRNDADALAAVLARNIFEGEEAPQLRALADYVFARDAELAAQPVQTIIAGSVHFEAVA